jgi:chromosomal replication initiator protein
LLIVNTGGVKLEEGLRELWEGILREMEFKLNKPSFETWVKIIKPVAFKDHVLYISVPNDFTKNWVETRYTTTLKDAIKNILQRDCEVQFVLSPQSLPEEEETYLPPQQASHSHRALNGIKTRPYLVKPQIYF